MIKYAIFLGVALALAAVFGWAFLPARHLPGNRTRHLRIRLHLRLHPGKGFAHLFSLWLRWSRLAMLRQAGRIRPALPLRHCLLDPREHSVFLGRAQYRHGLRVSLEEHMLVVAPPHAFKTAFLADVILRYPGPVIAVTTKMDVYALTSAVRAWIGPVHVFNPQYIGGVPSSFCWSPVDGCEDPATAIRRADAFAFAVSQKGVQDGWSWSATEIRYAAAQIGQASASRRLDPPLLICLDEVTQICPVPLPFWLSDSGGKGIQVAAVVHGEAKLAERWGDYGRQIVLDTSSVKVFLSGITDTATLEAASTLCGQASWKVRGQDHTTRHDVATPDMIRQLPAGFALVIHGSYAPVIARLPRAWKNTAYRRARRLGRTASLAEVAAYPAFVPPPRDHPDHMFSEDHHEGHRLGRTPEGGRPNSA